MTSANSNARLLVLSDAIPNRNGVGTYYEDLLTHLAPLLGHAEMIAATENSIFKQKRLRTRLPGDRTQPLHFPNVRAILGRVREVDPQILLTPSIGPFSVLTWLLARGGKRALVTGFHTSFDQLAAIYWQGLRRRIFTRFLHGWSARLIRESVLVAVNSSAMEEEARRLGARKILRVGTTLAEPFLHGATPHPGFIRRVFFGGRFAAEKNLGAILDAAAAHPDLEFRLAGDGPLRGEIESRAADLTNLTILDWLGRERILREIDDSDLLVLPSKVESFGSIAFEGMARDRIVLVSEGCGIASWPDLLPHLHRVPRNSDLAAAIADLRTRRPEDLRERARCAGVAARAFHHATLDQWVEHLARCAGDTAPGDFPDPHSATP
jgi:glycosyltransferase involved in cell wall biosynthesis